MSQSKLGIDFQVSHRQECPMAHGGAVSLRSLVKRYDTELAVDGIDLDIQAGEFFSLLGPSGCGKTTTLRIIAGFEIPTDGQVLIDGVDVANEPPEKRPVNTVFQSYALFPHLSVFDNVAFGLRFTDVDRKWAHSKVGEALEQVRLTGKERRKPSQLSGGQQQRVALARAIVLRPRVLLLDEPLGALDAKLRKELQLELVKLQRDIGITFVYVTHDQEEALTMSNRLAVMNLGQISQCGTPHEVYDTPVNSYVADFLGVANVLPVSMVKPGALGSMVVRPERVKVSQSAGKRKNGHSGVVTESVFVGSTTQLHIAVGSHTIQALVANDGRLIPARGDSVCVEIPLDAVREFPE